MRPQQISIQIPKPPCSINYKQKILLIGSCFTDHIGNALIENKFKALQNPSGVLFDPISVCNNLRFYLNKTKFSEQDLDRHDELYYSWYHHGDFSHIDSNKVCSKINDAHENAHKHLLEADWLIITLGSAFSYFLKEKKIHVANCHRAPANYFDKKLLKSNEILQALNHILQEIKKINPNIKTVLTISPVRHLRDGAIDNNRSKAQLITAVHELCITQPHVFYFPSYELVVDVLRDYRYYDIDLAHPNYLATEFVLHHFIHTYLDDDSITFLQEIKQIKTAQKHKVMHPETKANSEFMSTQLLKCSFLKDKYPSVDFSSEIAYFLNKNKD